MKLWITSTSQPAQPNADSVSSRRNSDTAVRPIGLLDGELRDRVERRLLPDDRDVGAMQRRHDAHVGRVVRAASRARSTRSSRAEWRSAVQQVEAVLAHHFVHAHGEREVVRRILEERIAADVDLVEVDARQEVRQPEWLLVGDEMDLVPALRERDAELGRDGAGAAVGRDSR